MNKFNPNIFDINHNAIVKVQEIGTLKSKLVTIENVFKDPDKVKNFLNTMSLADNIQTDLNKVRGFYPGYQTYFSYDIGELGDMLFYYANTIFQNQIRGWSTAYQCIDGAKKVYKQCNIPHTDGGQLAGNIFLSDIVEEGSGTRFYKFKETQEESPIANNCMYRKQKYGYANPSFELANFNPVNSDDRWESYFLAEEKFNCLNMYEGALFHSAYIQPETYTTNLRKSLSILSQS